MTLGTFDLYFLTFSPGNTDLLSAARAGIDMMCFSLLHHTLFPVKSAAQFLCLFQVFLIFTVTCRNISGKDTVVCVNDQYKSQHVQNSTDITSSHKRSYYYQKKRNTQCEPCKLVHTVTSLHKFVYFISHYFLFSDLSCLTLLQELSELLQYTWYDNLSQDTILRRFPVRQNTPV